MVRTRPQPLRCPRSLVISWHLVASYSLLLFETNVRSASVLGIVGAGGVGFVLGKYMGPFQYRYLVGALLLIVIAVTAIDRCSDAVRRRPL